MESSRDLGRLPLRWAAVLYMALPVLLASGLAGGYVLSQYEARALHSMEEDVELVARSLAVPLGHAVGSGRMSWVERILESAFTIQRVYGAHVYDLSGELIATTAPVPDDPPQGEIGRLVARGQREGHYTQMGEENVYSYFVPLVDVGSRIVGLLQVTRPRRELEKSIGQLRLRGLSLLGATLVICSLLAYRGHQRVLAKPLEQLVDDMSRIATGDREHRARPAGPTEVQRLGHALNGMLDGLASARKEVHSRKKIQRDLEAQLRDAYGLAIIGELSAGLAHELGGPLSIVKGTAKRCSESPDLPESLAGPMERLRKQGERMETLVRQLLDVGREKSAAFTTCSSSKILCETVSRVTEETGEEGRVERVPSSEDVPLWVAPERMLQALSNLVRNALAAPRVESVRLGCFSEAGGVRLVVDDDGQGIPKELRERVFEPFVTTKAPGRGSGLGLVVARRVAAEHGGRLTLGESPEGGARFEIFLPSPDACESSRNGGKP